MSRESVGKKSRHRDRSRPALRVIAGVLLIALATIPFQSRADTVASLLGNFTINQFCGVNLTDDSVKVHYAVVFGQLPALRELHLADANGDGVTSQAERDAYAQRLAPEFASKLTLLIDGLAVPLRLTHWRSSLPAEQGGFSLRLDADFTGSLPSAATTGTHHFNFSNQNFDGRFGWHEIVVQAVPSIQVFDTNAFNTSLTSGLTQALQALPSSGPLDERAVHLSFTRGAAPAGLALLGPRPGESQVQIQAATPTAGSGEGEWLQRQTRGLVQLISAPHVEPRVKLLALLAAFALGALHALSPGHGKTVVGAYLVGSRGTPKHAAFLGFTVTLTHTLGVFALGFATLFASRFIVPERLFPILSLISGLIVLGMGIILLAQRWRGAMIALARLPRIAYYHSHSSTPGMAVASGPIEDPALYHHPHADHDHGHHDHDHHSHGRGEHVHGNRHHHHDVSYGAEHGHRDGPDGSLTHSHGGSMHSHGPPGADGREVTWRSLLALGISGGLVPCPSAMVLLLTAVALNKTLYGMLLVVGFSFGLALTLTAVGMAFLYARTRLRRPSAKARWPHLLPVLSAGVITAVGLMLCFGALQSARL
jgi:ABC-type nickel/cobalt efflux system permease component RcnA